MSRLKRSFLFQNLLEDFGCQDEESEANFTLFSHQSRQVFAGGSMSGAVQTATLKPPDQIVGLQNCLSDELTCDITPHCTNDEIRDMRRSRPKKGESSHSCDDDVCL